MKKQITIIFLLLIAIGFVACKKAKGTYVDIMGRWQVAKVETTVTGSPMETYPGISSDSFEFRDNEGNEMVVNLNSKSYIGHYYVMVNNGFKFNFDGKARSGEITTISANKLEFTVTLDGVTPQTTEKYYLTR